MFEALEYAAAHKWTNNEELLAELVEMVHQLWRFTAPIKGTDGTQHLVLDNVPVALRIARPTDKPEPVKPVVRRNDHAKIREFFRGGG